MTEIMVNSRSFHSCLIQCRNKALWSGVVSLCLFIGCYNPFLPPIGTPPAKNNARSTPAGVINQLKNAYETRNVNLFKTLLSTTYRFYISQSYSVDPEKRLSNYLSETFTDTFFIPNSSRTYFYWTLQDEIVRHEHMFEQAARISFTTSFTSNTSYYYHTIAETTSLVQDGDSIRYSIQSVQDTVGAVVSMVNGEISLWIDKTATEPNYYIAIQEQQFYLVRDPVDATLWVIEKWFDLGS